MTDPLPETDWLAAAASRSPDSVALIEDDGAPVTYGELDELAARAVGQLHRSFDLVPADLMGFAPFSPKRELLAAIWATWRLGAAAMLVDPQGPVLTGGSVGTQGRWGVPAFVTNLQITADPIRPGAAPQADQLHTVLLTSGSSGEPRPVRLTHGNVAAAVTASQNRLGNTFADRWLLALPIHHIGGLSILWRSAAAGGTVVVHDQFDAGRVAGAMRDGAVTIASVVPTMLYRILQAEPGPYEGMRAVLLGGAGADRELVETALNAGLPVLQTYGLTEACSQVATVVPGTARAALGTAGPPLAEMAVTIAGDQTGEILIDGPAVSPGYLGEPDRTGPHRTGDVGYRDEAGRIVIVGRSDDLIVTGGENVYPGGVATAISRHPGVARVEVTGVPDPEWGQLVAAVVVADESAQAELEQWSRRQLVRHEVPKRWIFVDSLPLLGNGKVDRAAVQRLAARG
jgi:O-succinylbenzoic acid--CoA ligase